MNENEFEVDGVILKEAPSLGDCDGCYFDRGDDVCASTYDVPHCAKSLRSDRMFVIFVEVQDERAKG